MRQGNLGTIATQGDLGEPRPALVIHSNLFGEHTSTTALPITRTLVDAPLTRVTVQPNAENGLQKTSQVIAGKVGTVKRDKLGKATGQIDADVRVEVDRCLAVLLGGAR